MHVATFRGVHNHSKAKALILLNSDLPRGLTARDISILTGLSIAAVKSLLWRLHKWKYVIDAGTQHGIYDSRRYLLGARGLEFIQYIPNNVLALIVPELQARYNQNNGKIHW